MKDSFLNLLVFLLVFVGAAVFLLAAYGLSMALVPGGKGLIFASPYAAALMPSLVFALVVALYRSLRFPGWFPATWLFLAAAFLLTLTLPLPWIQQLPSVRASDDSPLVPGRFLTMADGSLLLANGHSAVVIPGDGRPMEASALAEYDGLNQRFVLSSGEVKDLGPSGPERNYFSYTPPLVSLNTDLLAIYSTLRESMGRDSLLFWNQAWAVTWLFLGLYLAFSLRTWPLIHVVLVLLLARLGIVLLVYAFWTVPLLVDLWLPHQMLPGFRDWAPVGLIDLTAATLFFLTGLSKPHRKGAL